MGTHCATWSFASRSTSAAPFSASRSRFRLDLAWLQVEQIVFNETCNAYMLKRSG
jgi:hypothetical protein